MVGVHGMGDWRAVWWNVRYNSKVLGGSHSSIWLVYKYTLGLIHGGTVGVVSTLQDFSRYPDHPAYDLETPLAFLTLEQVLLCVHVRIVGDDVKWGPAGHHLKHEHAQCPPIHTEA